MTEPMRYPDPPAVDICGTCAAPAKCGHDETVRRGGDRGGVPDPWVSIGSLVTDNSRSATVALRTTGQSADPLRLRPMRRHMSRGRARIPPFDSSGVSTDDPALFCAGIDTDDALRATSATTCGRPAGMPGSAGAAGRHAHRPGLSVAGSEWSHDESSSLGRSSAARRGERSACNRRRRVADVLSQTAREGRVIPRAANVAATGRPSCRSLPVGHARAGRRLLPPLRFWDRPGISSAGSVSVPP
jgi:hypothetical protein